MGGSGCFLTQLSLKQAVCLVGWSVVWVHRISQALFEVVIHGLLLNCKTGVSEIPQGSVLALVILIVFIIEMTDGAERPVNKFT